MRRVQSCRLLSIGGCAPTEVPSVAAEHLVNVLKLLIQFPTVAERRLRFASRRSLVVRGDVDPGWPWRSSQLPSASGAAILSSFRGGGAGHVLLAAVTPHGVVTNRPPRCKAV